MPATRRVLIVSPHFPPVNAPDLHRVRTALPYFAEFGWEPTVLAVDPRDVDLAQDPLLEQSVPPEVTVIRTRALPLSLTRRFGLGSLALRSRRNLRRAAETLLRARRFDAVFFSTTEFPLLTLGPRWHARFGVPFLADWQDPWLSDFYERTHTPPPGGRLKYALSRRLAQHGEPRVVRAAAHLVSVSAGYIDELAARYPDWDRTRATVLPFAAPVRDFELLPALAPALPEFGVPPDTEVWLSAGRGGADLAPAARALFQAIARDRTESPARWARRRLVFLGTSYATGSRAQPSFPPLAAEAGITDLVVELPARAPYFSTLAALQRATRLIVLGSTDASYTASKVYPYVLARRPTLALLHERSGAVEFLRQQRCGPVFTFREGETPAALSAQLTRSGWLGADTPPAPTSDPAALEPHTARAMTRQLTAILDRIARATTRPAAPAP